MSVQPPTRYVLGEFELEPGKYLLRRRDEIKHLPELPFQVLLYLVEHRDRYVSREELLEHFWDGCDAYEETLTKCISTIRTELNDPPTAPTYIQTRKKVGYRFIGPFAQYTTNGTDPGLAPGQFQEQTATPSTKPLNRTIHEPKEKRRSYKRDLLLAFLFLVIGANVAYLLYRSRVPSPPVLKMTRLTSTGNVRCAAISPDGNYVAYAIEENGKASLWLNQIAQPRGVEILPAEEVQYVGLSFSPNGGSIYFVRNEATAEGVVYEVPTLGGYHRRILTHSSSAVTLSPDGKRLAFLRKYPSNPAGDTLVLANVDGTNEMDRYTVKLPDRIGGTGPAWSPDGKVIAFGVQKYSGVMNSNVVGVDVETGAAVPLSLEPWETVDLGRVAWLPDSVSIVVTRPPGFGQVPQIFRLEYPVGNGNRVVADLNGYSDVTAARTGTIASLRTERTINIWIMASGSVSRSRQLTFGAEREDGVFGGLGWTPDGRILYRSLAGGQHGLWTINPEGSGNQVLSTSTGIFPSMSPDGKYIISISRDPVTGLGQIWRAELDGTNRKQITNGKGGVWFPQYSPDGKWVLYGAISETGSHAIWRVSPVGSGEPVRITEHPTWVPAVSPDGKLIACNWLNEQSGQWTIAILPFEGGPPLKILDVPGIYNRRLVWTPEGKSVAVIRTENGVSNIWAHPIDGGPRKQLTNFTELTILNFAWSPDGKYLALSRGAIKSDVVLVNNFY